MPKTPAARLRDAILIAALGAAVALAPDVWYSLAWPGTGLEGIVIDRWLFWFSVSPFVLVAFLRAGGVLRRPAGFVATVVVAALVILGQLAGLDPNDSSSTAPLALAIAPIYACVAVLLLLLGELMLRGLVAFFRDWRQLPPD